MTSAGGSASEGYPSHHVLWLMTIYKTQSMSKLFPGCPELLLESLTVRLHLLHCGIFKLLSLRLQNTVYPLPPFCCLFVFVFLYTNDHKSVSSSSLEDSGCSQKQLILNLLRTSSTSPKCQSDTCESLDKRPIDFLLLDFLNYRRWTAWMRTRVCHRKGLRSTKHTFFFPRPELETKICGRVAAEKTSPVPAHWL